MGISDIHADITYETIVIDRERIKFEKNLYTQ